MADTDGNEKQASVFEYRGRPVRIVGYKVEIEYADVKDPDEDGTHRVLVDTSDVTRRDSDMVRVPDNFYDE